MALVRRFLTTIGGPTNLRTAWGEDDYPVEIVAAGSPGIIPPLYAFVFRPGGPPNAVNVFSEWPDLMAAVSGVQGAKLVVLDASIQPCVTTPGIWNVQDVTFTAASGDSGADELEVAPGTIFQTTHLTLEGASFKVTAVAPVLETNGLTQIVLREQASIQSTINTGPFVSVQLGSNLSMLLDELSNIGDGVVGTVTVAAGAILSADLFGSSTIQVGALEGLGTATVNLESNCRVLSPQSITTLMPQPLVNVDSQVNALGAGPSGTVFFQFAFTTRTGTVMLQSTMSVDTQAGATGQPGDDISMQLVIDALVGATVKTELSPTLKRATGSLSLIVGGLSIGSHIVGMHATDNTGGRNIFLPAGNCVVTVQDL